MVEENEKHRVEGAIYRSKKEDTLHTLVGLKSRSVGLTADNETGYIEVPNDEFDEFYEDTGIHDHVDYCCTVHDLHASSGMHRGCLLR